MTSHHPEEPEATVPVPHLSQGEQQAETTAELSAITRLYELSTRLVLSSGLEALLEEVLHAVIELQGADFGNVQLYDPVSKRLTIVAQQGFKQTFLDCFRSVSVHERSACGMALARRERVIVFDTETDPAYKTYRHMAVLSGYRSVQSTPLFTRAGDILGMLSIHFRLPHSPSAHELRLTDLYAKQAAEMIERHRMEEELKRTNEALQKARADADVRLQVFQLILDRLSNGVFLVQGPHLRLLLANQAATTLWGAAWPQGQPEEEFLHQHGIQLLTPNGQPLPPEDLTGRRAMTTGETVLHRQLVICQSDGTRLPVLVDAIPFENLSLLSRPLSALPPTERVVLLVYQDVSTLKAAETLKDQFISLATHELRTPVTIIAGYADRLLGRSARGGEYGLNEWQREKVQEMKQASWQLTSLTEDLLDVTRIQAGEFKLELRSVDLVALTERVVRRIQATTDRHQLAFHTTLSQLWATVDAIRIEQVFSNLLSNAIKYSPDGGPIEVILEEHAETHEARFRVRDQGMGIPHAQQVHLFERFVRGENVRASGIRGTGLGLYLCRELIERHGGQIAFESEEDVGSTFFFSLPCIRAVQ
ncbi:hypothetical protein KDAU_45490 [Dictyobacter aurantiacus]|uniref:histidine kinase n=2 Tax=Dictyobacter aurantiacus TaxID=1936993 RepID=A0A401ZK64_9CHLR|nr:hypothetical protein KDAU_45490 [Dictyobacter aurantiacus]